MKRAVIALFTTLALLAQGGAWAATIDAMALPAMVDEAEMPCHGDADSAQKQSPCCGESCDCPELCAGQSAVAAPGFYLAAPEHAVFESPAVSALRLSVTPHHTLRPPIAL